MPRSLRPTRTIILSMHTDAVYVRKALQAGASGYIVKDAGVQELEAAIRAVMRGETYLEPRRQGHRRRSTSRTTPPRIR